MTVAGQDDETLVLAVQGGCRQAFETLVVRHSLRFYRIAYRYLANRQEAEDMVQEAFLKLWAEPWRWHAEKQVSFTTWFYQVVINLCLDARKRKKPVLVDEPVEGVSADMPQIDTLVLNQEHQLLEQVIAQLPMRQQTALNLCFYEQVSNKEAADVMGIRVKALESLLMRAKKRLKGLLEIKS